MTTPATTLQPPYYAVIATSIRTEGDNGYSEMAKQMLELASKQPGFLGYETARQEIGISVSYWSTTEAIKAWKENVSHIQAQNRAKEWYKSFRVRVCLVEREYGY
jgi:heme-degrading monooxygenase HmoA